MSVRSLCIPPPIERSPSPISPHHLVVPLRGRIIQRCPLRPVPAISCVLLVCVFISVLGNTIGYFQNYYSDAAAILAVNDIRRRLYDHVLHAPMSFFGTAGTSDVTSRLVGDCLGLQDGFKTIVGQSIQMPINAFMAFVVALLISWKLTMFIVFVGPVMLFIIQKFGKKMRRANRRAMQRNSSMLGQIEATLTGIRVVKGANAERFERRRYSNIIGGLNEQQLRMSRLDAIERAGGGSLDHAGRLHHRHLGDLSGAGNPGNHGGEILRRDGLPGDDRRCASQIRQAVEHAAEKRRRRDAHFSDSQLRGRAPRHMDNHRQRPPSTCGPIEREIRFQGVGFAYANSAGMALSEVDLSVAKGETVAIVGRNGSGKTTLLALLPRLFDPCEGKITIDCIDIQDVTLKSLREQVSVVTQDSVIFPVSIAENIAYGHPLAGRLKEKTAAVTELRQRIEAAARQAFAHDFIMEKPNGCQPCAGCPDYSPGSRAQG